MHRSRIAGHDESRPIRDWTDAGRIVPPAGLSRTGRVFTSGARCGIIASWCPTHLGALPGAVREGGARTPFKVYQPASSAVGMYQITDATFSEAKHYCIHDHVVVEDGPWFDASSCWFNILYSRVVPSHAIEMTSALLDRRVASAIVRYRVAAATPERQQDLAAVIHLCGPAAGDAYAARGFRLAAGQRCGDHDVGAYLAQVNAMKRLFARLAAAGL